MTDLIGGYGTKAGAAKNPWLLHLSAFREANPGMKNALQEAKKTYKKDGAPSQQKSSVSVLNKQIPKSKKVRVPEDFSKYEVSKLKEKIKNTPPSTRQYKNGLKYNERTYPKYGPVNFEENFQAGYELEGLVEGLRTKDLQQTKYYYNLLMKYVNKYGPDADRVIFE